MSNCKGLTLSWSKSPLAFSTLDSHPKNVWSQPDGQITGQPSPTGKAENSLEGITDDFPATLARTLNNFNAKKEPSSSTSHHLAQYSSSPARKSSKLTGSGTWWSRLPPPTRLLPPLLPTKSSKQDVEMNVQHLISSDCPGNKATDPTSGLSTLDHGVNDESQHDEQDSPSNSEVDDPNLVKEHDGGMHDDFGDEMDPEQAPFHELMMSKIWTRARWPPCAHATLYLDLTVRLPLLMGSVEVAVVSRKTPRSPF
ncbi:hypothetical protein PCANC_22813 [Puccinia coronata f. sp. avenae]|uniref:Uncharacterized protein n=1 Tax=Puccinia coronata f. sp. avenae TaxID=200324 RepID=A0A2N5UCS9_9BASI|nr:hypothetical protein PCANC_22813 [Puccinia coronata f. sp. avenae]PLW35757.1 hypothetical protein PCASD_20643 [Puccinia coronata f. sp. avenae]